MTTFVPRAARLEACEAEKWDQMKGVTEMWLERPLPATRPCFLSPSSLFHSVTGRCRLATIKPAESWSVCFPLSIHESGNRSVCHESEPDVLVKVGQAPAHKLNVIVSSALQLGTGTSSLKHQRATVWPKGEGNLKSRGREL